MIENLFTSHLAYITIKEVGTHHTIEKFHGKKIAFESISQEKKIKKMSYHRPPPLTGLPRCAGLTRLDSLRGERLLLLGVLQRGAVGHRTPIKFIHVNDEKS